MEDDTAGTTPPPCPPHFNPRPPCGGRQSADVSAVKAKKFQSTSSVWRTTHFRHRVYTGLRISIHVLRVEDDVTWRSHAKPQTYFNPRPPCGGRPLLHQCSLSLARISIHVLRVEDDPVSVYAVNPLTDFNPRPPCGGRHPCLQQLPHFLIDFNPRPPCGGRRCYGVTQGRRYIFQSTSSVWRTTGRRFHRGQVQ